MRHRSHLRAALCAALPIVFAVIVFKDSSAQTAGASVDVLAINLDPLIDTAAKDRNRFAVDIPHLIDALRVGTWSRSGDTATWRYSVRIPTAVSLSFHATNSFLPPSAWLIVHAGGDNYVYRAA